MKLLVMAKAPVPGSVKTRLCPPLDHDGAALVAAAALADTLDAVASSGADEHWIALDGPPGPWLPAGFQVIAQRGGDFAGRLAAAWDDVGGPTLQIGMDTPQVTSEDLALACATLERSTGAVLGPAEDGGWWALGMWVADARVFHAVPMSTPETGRLQRARLEALGLAPLELATLRDVDDWSDALAVAALAPSGRFAGVVRHLDAGVRA